MNKSIKIPQIKSPRILSILICMLLSLAYPYSEISAAANSFVQQDKVTVKGTVKDVKGELLIGVNILEKGTTTGTITDVNGEFTLSVSSENATLEFSYIGFATQEMPVGNQRDFQVTLKENTTGLDEVVVVGYGSQKKATVNRFYFSGEW